MRIALGVMMDRIGVVGLGRMGSAIATRFADQGVAVTGWTRSGRSVDDVESVPDLFSLVARADIIVLSLFDDAAVGETLAALLACPLAGKLVIDTSTIVPGTLLRYAAEIEAAGAHLSDAPISGGPEMVASGSCGIFIGGCHAAVERAQAALAPLSGRIFHVGPLGTGLVMKSINNAMLQSYFAGLAEQMRVARQAGLSLEMALTILSGGPAGAPALADRMPRILGHDGSVGFPIRGAAKDNAVFRRVAAEAGVATPTLDAASAMIAAAIDAGLAEADIGALIAMAYADA
ncbi:NAD(P)-dependent oxidoreductase [Roseicyclus sp.]|uniref:NAD(P)-dependent oxidoreductase n=1 Tax=Roseicyclus sp. TaxID=1914329 RepID=UPI003F6BEF3D